MGPVPEPYKAFPTGTAVVLQMLMAYYMYVKYEDIKFFMFWSSWSQLNISAGWRTGCYYVKTKNVNLTYFVSFSE